MQAVETTMQVRRAAERGHGVHGWLDTWHSFSFARYYDRRWMGFGPLRVINDDVIAAGKGFGEHPHNDMEIITYVLSGVLRHRDSAGHESELGAGGVQRMSAGTGIRHSEFNGSPTEPLHLLQIWIEPREEGVTPAYDDRAEALVGNSGHWTLASPDGRDGSLAIQQDAIVAVQRLAPGESAVWPPELGARQWLQVATGAVEVEGTRLVAGDGGYWTTSGERVLTAGDEPADLVLFDLP